MRSENRSRSSSKVEIVKCGAVTPTHQASDPSHCIAHVTPPDLNTVLRFVHHSVSSSLFSLKMATASYAKVLVEFGTCDVAKA